jgi:hypothetical protein
MSGEFAANPTMSVDEMDMGGLRAAFPRCSLEFTSVKSSFVDGARHTHRS